MPLIPALGRQRQADLCEFEACLVYRARPRTGSKATQLNPVSENQNKKQKTNKGAGSIAHWWNNCSACAKLWVLSLERQGGKTERQRAKAPRDKGSVLLFGSGGLGIGAEHGPWGRVWALLEEGPGCCRVCAGLGLIPLG